MSIEAMKQALKALEFSCPTQAVHMVKHQKAWEALRQAIEQAEKQEPIAFVTGTYGGRFTVKPLNPAMVLPLNMALYTTPQSQPCPYIRSTREGTHHCALSQREWVGLTDEEMHECWDSPLTPLGMKHVRMIEAKLKEKNT